ncbi:MAG: GNAT family N-acetyltransferase [Anaerolineales bacterium]|nr:GNAT family N-acetyltransferase [Anaerolineales bacterium]
MSKDNQNGYFRLLRSSDLPALEWDGEYLHFRRVYREVYEQSRIGRALPWVIDIPEDGIIGQLFVQLDSQNKSLADGVSRAYLFSFRIKPKHQGQGWGSKLLTHVETYLLERGYCWTTLRVSKTNDLARSFYEHRGYLVVGEDSSEWRYLDHRGIQRVVVDPSYRMEKCLFEKNSLAKVIAS